MNVFIICLFFIGYNITGQHINRIFRFHPKRRFVSRFGYFVLLMNSSFNNVRKIN